MTNADESVTISPEIVALFDEILGPAYYCPRCHQIPYAPLQDTNCGDRFCSSCYAYIMQTDKKCPSCNNELQQVFADGAARREIENVSLKCKFHEAGCTAKVKLIEFKSHIAACSFQPKPDKGSQDYVYTLIDSLQQQVLRVQVAQNEIKTQLDELKEQIRSQNITRAFNGSSDPTLHRQVTEATRRLQVLEDQVVALSLSRGTGSAAGNPLALEKRLEDLISQLTTHMQTSYDGVLMWLIDRYSERKKAAEAGTHRSVYSPAFYSSRYGYKMCVRAYLDGDGIGRGEFLSLFFVLMKGENDPVLTFPFPLRIKFTLMDQQSHTKNLSDSFDPDPKSTSFQLPTNEKNVGAGCPKFVQQKVVQTPAYLQNDCIYIRISVGRD